MGLMSKFKKDKSDDAAPEAPAKKAKKSKDKPAGAGGGPKQFLIEHGEKLVLGIVGLLLVLMIYSAFGREKLPDSRAPDDLKEEVAILQNQIESSEFHPDVSHPLANYEGLAKQQLATLPAELVAGTARLLPLPPGAERKLASKRQEPTPLPVEHIAAKGGVGPLFILTEQELLGLTAAERAAREEAKKEAERKAKEEEEARKEREERARARAEREADRKRRRGGDREAEQRRVERTEENLAARSPIQPLPIDLLNRGFQPTQQLKKGELGARGEAWVTVVGLVPRHKQLLEYNKTFMNAQGYDPERDRPQYLGARISRLEIPEGGGSQPLDWNEATVWPWVKASDFLAEERKAWVGEADEVIAEAYYHENLNHPLGPLALEPWTKWAAHPEVKLKGQDLLNGSARTELETDELEEKTQEADPNHPFGIIEEKVPGRRDGPGGRGERPIGRPGTDGMRVDISQQAEYYQVRLFDFTVEPGKRYRYRVQLALRNPHWEGIKPNPVAPRFLADISSRKKVFVETPWSEPTDLVVVPTGQQVFAGAVELPADGDALGESYATVLSRVLNFENGHQTAALFEVNRGGVVSGIAEGYEIDPVAQTVTEKSDSLVETDLLLLDLRGGPLTADEDPALAADQGRPAKMLFLDSEGNLRVRSQLEDEEAMLDYRLLSGEAMAPVPGPIPGPVPFPFPGAGPGPGPGPGPLGPERPDDRDLLFR